MLLATASIAILASSTLDGSAGTLAEISFLEDRVSISIPSTFALMSDEMRKLKYPNENRPAVVYTNDRGTINIAMSVTNQTLKAEQIEQAHQNLEKGFRNLYPSATWYRSAVFERDGRRFFTIDVRTPAIDTEIRNVILGTSFRGKLLLISFNVTRELEAAWIEIGHNVLASVVVKE